MYMCVHRACYQTITERTDAAWAGRSDVVIEAQDLGLGLEAPREHTRF